MSKGLGKRQRDILAHLDHVEAGCCWLVDLLPEIYTRAEYNAVYRAAMTLESSQRIEIAKFTYGHDTVAVYRPGLANFREEASRFSGEYRLVSNRPPERVKR
ncbi:MAG: hypothetical protein ACYC3X_26620 [Pirellulaceae bacterium]